MKSNEFKVVDDEGNPFQYSKYSRYSRLNSYSVSALLRLIVDAVFEFD